MPLALANFLRSLTAKVPLRGVLVAPFVVLIVGSVALVGYLSYQSGQQAVKNLGHQLVAETNERVTQELKTHLQTPLLINRLNVDAISQSQLELQNTPALESMLFNRLQQFEQVTGIVFVSPEGLFRVVERQPTSLYLGVANPPEPNQLYIYTLDNQGKRGQLVYVDKSLDVRFDRPWYQQAVARGKPGWSPISQYGSLDVLSLDASQPVYERATGQLLGVFTVHTELDYLSDFLHRLNISRSGQVLILDQNGGLVATSTQEKLYKVLPSGGTRKQLQPLTINESRDPLTRSLGAYLQRDKQDAAKRLSSSLSMNQGQYLEFSYNGEPQYIKITPFQDPYGLDWQIVTVIPKSHFLGAIQDNAQTTVMLCLLTIGATTALGLLTTNQLTARFAQLNQVSQNLSLGNLDQRLSTDRPISELNSLALTFNQMADQLQQSFTRIKTDLAESEEKFKIIFRSSPDPIGLTTLNDGRVVEANDSFLNLLGYSRQEMVGQRLEDLGVWRNLDDRAQFRDLMQQQGHVRNLELPLNTKTGQIKTLLLSAERIVIDGELLSLGIAKDISDRKQAESALRQSESLNQAILNALPDLIIRMHRDGTYLDFKPTNAFPIAYPNLQVGANIRDILPLDEAQRRLEFAAIALQTREIQVYEFPLELNGQQLWQEARVMPLNLDEVLVVVRDLTQRHRVEAELHISEARYREVVEGQTELVCRFQPDGTLTFANAAYCRYFGLDYKEVLNRPYAPVIFEADREMVAQLIGTMTLENPTVTIENRVFSRGKVRWTQWNSRAIFNEQGQFIEYQTVGRDITDRKQAEAEIQQLNQQLTDRVNELQTLFEVLPIGVAIGADPECRFARINPCLSEILRVPLHENASPGAPNSERPAYRVFRDGQELSTEDLPMQYASIHNLEVRDVTVDIVHPDGTVIKLLSYASPLRDEQGKVRGSIGGFVDITERTQMAEALRQSETRFRQLAETVREGFFVYEVETAYYSYVNPAYSAIRATPDHVDYWGMEHWLEQIHPDDRPRIDAALQREQAGENFSEEYRFIRADGELRWLRSQAFPLKDEMGAVVRIVGTVEDITERKQVEIALQQSEARFQEIAQTINQVVYVISITTGHYLYISPAYENLWGYSCESLYHNPKSWLDRIHSEDLSFVLQNLDQLYAGTQLEMEYRIIAANGKVHWIRSESLIVPDENGNPSRIVGLAEDITDRKRLEQSLRSQAETDHLFAIITQNIRQSLELEQILATTVVEVQQTLNADRVLIFRLNLDGSGQVIQEAVLPDYPMIEQMRWEDEHFSAAAYEFYGQGKPRIVLDVAIDDWAACLAEFMEIAGVKSKIVAPIVQAGGTEAAYVWGLLIVHACSHYRQWQPAEADLLQKICNQLAIAINQANLYQQLQVELTERRQAEVALGQSEELFRRAFDDAPVGISLISPTGQFLKANTYYCKLLGYTEAELLNLTFQNLTHPDDLKADLDGLRRMLDGEIPAFQIEKRYITKQGEVIPVLMNAATIQDQNGQPLYIVGQIQDIRDRYRIERMKNEFISVISHELRTPLTSIRGALGILSSGIYHDRPAKANHMLNIALNNSERLVRLVNDILDLERLESGKVQLVMQSCQVADLMQQAVDSVQAIADQTSITLSITPCTATLWASPDAVIQTLTNLLSNAIKFSPPGSTVWLTAEIKKPDTPPTPYFLFTVQDQGRGIPADKIEAIFEQFQQVDVSDSRKKGGTGLGLAICKKIVQQHGGQIWVESQPGQGSCFYVALPQVEPDAPH